MRFRRRTCGLCLAAFGMGVFFGAFMHGIGMFMAALALILGFWLLFMC